MLSLTGNLLRELHLLSRKKVLNTLQSSGLLEHKSRLLHSGYFPSVDTYRKNQGGFYGRHFLRNILLTNTLLGEEIIDILLTNTLLGEGIIDLYSPDKYLIGGGDNIYSPDKYPIGGGDNRYSPDKYPIGGGDNRYFK